MTCDRCYRPLDEGEHGLWRCPLEPRRTAPTVWPDDIPGGVEIRNGLCHEDGSPRRFYSRSEIRAACEVKGLIPYHDVYVEEGNQTIKDARVHDDWLRSSEARKAGQAGEDRRADRARRQREAHR